MVEFGVNDGGADGSAHGCFKIKIGTDRAYSDIYECENGNVLTEQIWLSSEM